ncbi:endo alpha-1,4 polygalactosaminidase [Streptomyces sp. NPDC005805]|uniref:endo alpha-1,4 polygalactosaminidase n=1 Tax=Streptomyces sp. NPDC005805 TaxID=3157068 RepID=UPI0033FF94FC
MTKPTAHGHRAPREPVRLLARTARGAAAGAAAALLLLVVACTTGGGAQPRPSAQGASGPAVRPPEPGAVFDYQIGGPYRPAKTVAAVARDRSADPADGLYNICYVNAYQAQPGAETDWWHKHHPELLLRGVDGGLVIDEDWDEPLLDISTPARRAALMKVVGPWIDGCAESGYDAVEPDNLDSWTRSEGQLTADDAVAFARLLTDRGHARGLAVAQKNTAELLDARDRTGFDFAVAEECARYDECAAYLTAYQGRVFAVEYRGRDFTAACRAWAGKLSVTLRDREVRPAGEQGHLRRTC